MANILYRKQKQQKSLNNGVTWIDTGEYRVGDILENPSNCTSDDSKQCRWTELPETEGYYCDGYNKYTVQVEECSENGIIWTRTGNQKKGNTLIENNSLECGAVIYRWVDDGIVCLEDYFAYNAWTNVGTAVAYFGLDYIGEFDNHFYYLKHMNLDGHPITIVDVDCNNFVVNEYSTNTLFNDPTIDFGGCDYDGKTINSNGIMLLRLSQDNNSNINVKYYYFIITFDVNNKVFNIIDSVYDDGAFYAYTTSKKDNSFYYNHTYYTGFNDTERVVKMYEITNETPILVAQGEWLDGKDYTHKSFGIYKYNKNTLLNNDNESIGSFIGFDYQGNILYYNYDDENYYIATRNESYQIKNYDINSINRIINSTNKSILLCNTIPLVEGTIHKRDIYELSYTDLDNIITTDTEKSFYSSSSTDIVKYDNIIYSDYYYNDLLYSTNYPGDGSNELFITTTGNDGIVDNFYIIIFPKENVYETAMSLYDIENDIYKEYVFNNKLYKKGNYCYWIAVNESDENDTKLTRINDNYDLDNDDYITIEYNDMYDIHGDIFDNYSIVLNDNEAMTHDYCLYYKEPCTNTVRCYEYIHNYSTAIPGSPSTVTIPSSFTEVYIESVKNCKYIVFESVEPPTQFSAEDSDDYIVTVLIPKEADKNQYSLKLPTNWIITNLND